MGGDLEGRIFLNTTVFDGFKLRSVKSILVDHEGSIELDPPAAFNSKLALKAKKIDGQGLTLVPPFHDTHMHLLSYAANILSYDIRSETAVSKKRIADLVKKAAFIQRNSNMVRLQGLEHNFQEGVSFVDRNLLDQALPDRPLIIQTTSGHAHILNSVALNLAGIKESTNEPPGVTFERTLTDGKLNGVIYESGEYLEKKLPSLEAGLMKDGIISALTLIHSRGINYLTDATHLNDISRYELISKVIDEFSLNMHLIFMPGVPALRTFVEAGRTYRSTEGKMMVGHSKIMMTNSSGVLHPDKKEFQEMVRESHFQGFPVAIHSVDMDSIDLILEVLKNEYLLGDRIEHASELRDDQIVKMASLGVSVSTQPSFIYERGDTYLSSQPSSNINSLYRINSLRKAGITVSASSDSPVTYPDPMKTIYSAMTRKTKSGKVLNSKEAISTLDSLRMLTTDSVTISGLRNGSLQDPKTLHEDSLVLDTNLASGETDNILGTKISRVKDFK
jgi:predicted amidohydrolase YtcJ